jgi:hypothetical protein
MIPPNMKTGSEDSKAYFRTNQSCHASGVTPPNMKTGSEDSKAYFRTKWQVNLWFKLMGEKDETNLRRLEK